MNDSRGTRTCITIDIVIAPNTSRQECVSVYSFLMRRTEKLSISSLGSNNCFKQSDMRMENCCLHIKNSEYHTSLKSIYRNRN